MSLISFNQLHIGFRGPDLLDGVDCRIYAGEHIGLLGRNGAGKTTLMRILAGDLVPDRGEVVKKPGLNIGMLPQDVPQLSGGVAEIIAEGVNDLSDEDSWKGPNLVEQILSRMSLDGDARFETMSSGMKRRVLLGRALVSNPDLLLLDEPTNHLDIAAIGWLEEFLSRWSGAILFVTHDRTFLQKMATRIIELDRGRLFDWSCDYSTFLQRKDAALAAEEKQNALFDKKLALEEAWIREGIKARRTRNEGRVRQLKDLRQQRHERRTNTGAAKIAIQHVERSGSLVAKIRDIAFGYDSGPKIVDGFSTTIMRGDKVGIMGSNGAGKTTLLRLLLGQLPPQTGEVRMGTNLQLVYYDQLREQLDENATVQENVSSSSSIQVGKKTKHIIGYLQDFLFSPEKARMPVQFLSGGERSRVQLARLFAQPANVIVLDEPTNDLDTETLEMLELRLVEFTGTVLLVSHDRTFLNNVVTSTLVFGDDGLREFDGGYDDWLRVVSQAGQAESTARSSKRQSEIAAKTAKPDSGQRKLKYKERQELVDLPGLIERLETKIADLHTRMADPDFYQLPRGEISAAQNELTEREDQLARAFGRWEELEELAD